MSRDGSITLEWAGGEHLFRLGWGELRSIQEACDAGPFAILERLGNGAWRLDDISSVIRFGLIGGGMPPVEAAKMVRLYVEKFPPAQSCIVAHAVLTAGCIGAPEEQIEKKIRSSGSGQQRIDDLPNGKIRFGAIYGVCHKLNMTPQQIDAMSMWQYFAMVAAASDDASKLSEAEANELWEYLNDGERG